MNRNEAELGHSWPGLCELIHTERNNYLEMSKMKPETEIQDALLAKYETCEICELSVVGFPAV